MPTEVVPGLPSRRGEADKALQEILRHPSLSLSTSYRKTKDREGEKDEGNADECNHVRA